MKTKPDGVANVSRKCCAFIL